jgi:hypothetical protein
MADGRMGPGIRLCDLGTAWSRLRCASAPGGSPRRRRVNLQTTQSTAIHPDIGCRGRERRGYPSALLPSTALRAGRASPSTLLRVNKGVGPIYVIGSTLFPIVLPFWASKQHEAICDQGTARSRLVRLGSGACPHPLDSAKRSQFSGVGAVVDWLEGQVVKRPSEPNCQLASFVRIGFVLALFCEVGGRTRTRHRTSVQSP